VVGSVFTRLILTFMIRLTPKDIVLEQYQISCGNFIAETKKYVYLNDIAIDSLNPRYDLHNNNGGHVKNVKNVEKSIKITKIQSLYLSVKSSTELMLYFVLTMPTLNKAYLFIIIIHLLVSNSVAEWRCFNKPRANQISLWSL
jgi:hypothetical protein